MSEASPANSLSRQRILITGGAGFIGSHLVDALLAAGARDIVAIDNMIRGRPANLERAMASGRVRLVEGDIRDHDLLDGLVAQSDIVFHQAALRITHCAAAPRLAFDVMAGATFDLLQSCVAHGVKKVVAASSASIYGLAPEFPTTEAAAPYADRTLYGGFKLLNESLLRSFNDMYGLNCCALRYFNVYGTRMDIHGKYTEVLIRWMERIEAGLPPVIFGDGLQTMDFVEVRDVARANVLAALSAVGDASAFNVAAGTEVSLKGLAEALLRTMGRPDLSVEHQPPRAINPVERRLASTAKAEELLGFRTTIGLDRGLRDLVAWWRAERNTLARELPVASAA